ncbi:MAG: AMP-binding protein [Kiritimatiellae bacterium]|nr:AMP-binding protein [Kiritimatiellia bacterium]
MKIVCFGDSLTSCGGDNGRFSDILADRFPGHSFVNKGQGGDGFTEALLRLEADVLREKPDIVLVEFGANDWWRAERPPQAWARDLEKILGSIREAGATPVVLGVFGDYLDEWGRRSPKSYGSDARSQEYRMLEESTARRHGCPYVANIQERIIGRRWCWTDPNHPNEFGNRYVADAIEPILEELLGVRALPVRKPGLFTMRDIWLEAVALAPKQAAVIDGEQRLSFGEADELVRRIAAALADITGRPSPIVSVFLPNCLEYFLLYWAVARLGGVIVPLNTWLRRESLLGILRRVQPDVLIMRSPEDREVFAAAAAAPPKVSLALHPGNSHLMPWHALLADRGEPPHKPVAHDALFIVMHTSGTTAVPKGAMMRHCDLLFNISTTINAHQFNPSDVHLLVNPMFHCTALYSSLPTAAYTKTPVVIASPTDPARLMQLVEKERLTTFLSIPSVFQQILKLKNLGDYDTSSLRLMAYAGSPMPVSCIRRLHERFPHVELHNFFGLTETISMTHVLSGEEALQRPDSIGKLLPFVEALIVDEEGNVLPPGRIGELLFARENVICGYFGEPGRLEEAVIEVGGRKWFRTGDLATVDEDGYFFVRGRKKDMIIVGGENVYAAEVEAVLMSHEKVEEAAVIGVPATGAATYLGEVVEAYVVRADSSLTERELRRHCFERLASYKVPRRIVFVDALPRNPSGKVLKDRLGCSADVQEEKPA